MSPRPWMARVHDILESIANARSYIEGMTFDTFVSDRKTLRAATYEIGIIGEAARHIPADVQERYPGVPWSNMRGIRNAIVHEYFRIDVAVLWDTITHDLPPLVAALNANLEQEA